MIDSAVSFFRLNLRVRFTAFFFRFEGGTSRGQVLHSGIPNLVKNAGSHSFGSGFFPIGNGYPRGLAKLCEARFLRSVDESRAFVVDVPGRIEP